MKKIIVLLFIALSTTIFVGAINNKVSVRVYSVAFYNLENLFDTINANGKYDEEFSPAGARRWNTDKYNSKLKNMAYTLSQLGKEYCPTGPAVIGVSELENKSVLDDLVKTGDLASVGYEVVHYDSPDRRGVDVGLLYNPRLFQVTASCSVPLVLPSDTSFKTRDQLVVSGFMGSDRVHFIVNHWPSRLGGESASSHLREAAAALCKKITDSLLLAEPNSNVIIMGDLNDDPTNKSVKEVLNAKKDDSQVEKGGLYNPFCSLFEKGIGSLAYRGQWNMFDQIMLSSNLLGKDRTNLKFWKAEVFNKPFLTNDEGQYKGYPKRTYAGGAFLNGYSDHFPVLTYFVKEVK